MQQMIGDAHISAELQYGYAGGDEEQMQRYALQRSAAFTSPTRLGLGRPPKPEVAAHTKELRALPTNRGNRAGAMRFQSSLKEGSAGNRGDIGGDRRRRAGHQVSGCLAGPGYVLPADVKKSWSSAYRNGRWSWARGLCELRSKRGSDRCPADRVFRRKLVWIEIPPRISVDAVEFPAAAFVDQVAVAEPEVRAYYDQNPARFPRPAAAPGKKPATAKADPAADYAAVRSSVETALKFDRAPGARRQGRIRFAYELYTGRWSRTFLDTLLSSHKLAAKTIAPFTHEAGPSEFGASKDIADAAFRLDSDRYSEAVPSPAGSVILLWKQLLPSRQPLLAEVRAKVRSDYIEGEKRRRFVELGRTLKGAIESRLSCGKPSPRRP